MFKNIRIAFYFGLGIADLVVADRYGIFKTNFAFVPAVILMAVFIITLVDALLEKRDNA